MKKLRDAIGILALFLFTVSFSIALVIFFTPLYKWSTVHFGIPEYLGMAKETLFKNYHILLSYLINPWSKQLHMPDFSSSPNGLFHFYEVKRLFLLNNITLLISGTVAAFFIQQLKKERRIWILIKPFFFMLLIPVVLLFFLLANFDRMFVLFHELAFNNDAWLFDPSTDPIILALPQEFFMYSFAAAFLLIEGIFFSGYHLAKKYAFKS